MSTHPGPDTNAGTGADAATGTSVTVESIRQTMDAAYPPRLAEKWDAVGLICGDPHAPVRKVAFALDCTDEVARRAVDIGADMLIVHHPLLLRGVESVAADTPKGRVLHTLITGGVALFAAHTNADKARPGVNDKLAELVGITPGRPIVPETPPARDKWGVNVPVDAAEAVKDAVFAAGAGEIGNYRRCAYETTVAGQFEPVAGAEPAEGEIGVLHRGEEACVEFVAPAARRAAIVDALRAAHPYEEPAFDVTAMQPDGDLDKAEGLGRVSELPEPMSLRQFTQQVANALPETAWGVRAAGDPDQMVSRVAVSSGAGDSFLDASTKLGVDVYVTSDMRHHPVDEHLRAGGPAVIDTAHWASEFPWTAQAAEVIRAHHDVECDVISVRTDPWTVSAHPATDN